MSLRQKAGFLHADADLVERIGVYHDLRSIYAQEKVQKQKSRADRALQLQCASRYILLFGIGALCSMLIFTWLVTFTIIVVDVMTMLLTGINGSAAVSKCCKEGLLSRNTAFWMGIAQFVYCVDVVCAVALVCTIVGQEHALKQSYNTGNMSIVQTEKDGVE